jgi:hypothetical protein
MVNRIQENKQKGKMESILAYSTVFLALVTATMAWQTWRLAVESKDASYRQIGVQTWLDLEKRFDSPQMLRARKKLAQQLRQKTPVKRDDISDTVPCFFEDLGTLYRTGYIDQKLATSSFSVYATRYWEALRPFVDEERRRYNADSTISEDFEFLAKTMRQPNDKIDQQQLDQFLDDESRIIME